MSHNLIRLFTLCIFMVSMTTAHAVDSYRYAHVTIDTPWNIFLFLLVIILLPFILMAVLYWHFAVKSAKEKKEQALEESKEAND